MVPNTVERVPRHTADQWNRQIRREAEQRVAQLASAGDRQIQNRLEELDREWDVERVLEANAATASLIGLGLGTFVNRKFFALPAMVAGFLLQHAVQGWCPPLPVFRRFGFRTQPEIEAERYALKAVRGDFDHLEHPSSDEAWSAVRRQKAR